jgi:hypothetical protein
MSEHRVSMRGTSWRRFEDPVSSRDPRVRAVVASLATLPAPSPRPEFRAELRAQLVAITPRIVAESATADLPMVDIVPAAKREPVRRAETPRRPRHNDSLIARLRRVPIGRPLAVVASVVTVFALLLGGAVWMSQKSLPGDSLYGLKRASERLQLATATSPTEEASDHLEFAEIRAGEVRDLLGRTSAAGRGPQADAAVSAGTARLIQSTLASADSDVKAAASLLGEQAVKNHSAGPLDTMTTWAPGQLSRLHQIAAAMPDQSLRARTESSAQLVGAALVRAKALAPKVGCSCLGSTGTDELGPMPCGSCPTTTPALSTPGGSTSAAPSAEPKPARARTGAATGRPGQTTTTGSTGTSPAASGSSTAGAPRPSSTPTPGLHLPSLTVPSSLPVGVSSCGIGATLGPIGIGIGLCPAAIKVSLHP